MDPALGMNERHRPSGASRHSQSFAYRHRAKDLHRPDGADAFQVLLRRHEQRSSEAERVHRNRFKTRARTWHDEHPVPANEQVVRGRLKLHR